MVIVTVLYEKMACFFPIVKVDEQGPVNAAMAPNLGAEVLSR